ncbi:unnamed protein product [Symbiodinium sp. CCMP2456]|nr:unnamed protein product [Symbiodinium sp. CCMP2456]
MNVRVLGTEQQVWDLFGKVGGYMSLLILLFNIYFVKKFPDNGVAQIYEEWTFVSERLKRS